MPKAPVELEKWIRVLYQCTLGRKVCFDADFLFSLFSTIHTDKYKNFGAFIRSSRGIVEKYYANSVIVHMKQVEDKRRKYYFQKLTPKQE